MGTRGAVGIRMNGIDKIGFNHYDSYPSCLGEEIIKWLKHTNKSKLKKLFKTINFDSDCEVFDFENHTMKSSFQENSLFMRDSLFCEYAYIVNLDENVLEFYVGFNKNPNAKGRYAAFKIQNDIYTDTYYGVKLSKKIPLNDMFKGKYKIENEKFVKI